MIRFKTNKEFIAIIVPFDAISLEITMVINKKLGLSTLTKVNIIGTITKDKKFDFDCEKLVERLKEPEYSEDGLGKFTYKYDKWIFVNKDDAFISAIEATGELYFENPYKKPDESDPFYLARDVKSLGLYEEDLNCWKEYESKTLKEDEKVLIIEVL